MTTTASVSENRVTVCLTWRQRDYLTALKRRYQIGFSEALRRVLDDAIKEEPKQ